MSTHVALHFFRMASLLKKFRIKFSDVVEVTDISKRPSKDRFDISTFFCLFTDLFYNYIFSIHRYLALPLGDELIDESSLDKKTLKHIRLGELLHEHSSTSRLIVV